MQLIILCEVSIIKNYTSNNLNICWYQHRKVERPYTSIYQHHQCMIMTIKVTIFRASLLNKDSKLCSHWVYYFMTSQASTHTHARMHAHTHTHTHTHIHTHTHKQTHAHIPTHAHTQTYMLMIRTESILQKQASTWFRSGTCHDTIRI